MSNTDFRIIDETETGYKRAVRVQEMFFGPNGGFVSKEEFENAKKTDGYGSSGYGN